MDYVYCHTDFGSTYANANFEIGKFYKVKKEEYHPDMDYIFVEFELIPGGAWFNDTTIRYWFYTKSELRKAKIKQLTND